MTYKHFYWTIIFRLTILVLIAGLTTYLFLQEDYLLGGVALVFLIIQAVWIIRYFNKLNEWIAFFLLGIENEDTTLKAPPKTDNKAINEVYKGMSRLNELFWQTKKEINTREYYFKTVINQSATGLFSVNEKGRVININPAATNSAMFARLEEDMDVNCGQIVDGGKTVEQMGEEIFRLWLAVASGTQSKSEAFGYGDNEFVPWQIGAVM